MLKIHKGIRHLCSVVPCIITFRQKPKAANLSKKNQAECMLTYTQQSPGILVYQW